jgi:hypothetical protein
VAARACPSCRYNVISSVAAACPNCGAALPRAARPIGVLPFVLVVLAGAATWVLVEATSGSRATPDTSSPAASVAPDVDASPRSPAEDTAARVGRLVAQLEGDEAWAAADELAGIDDPRARRALMDAYDRREYRKMAGATAFYVRARPPRYREVLVALLRESKDLAVAQELILSQDPKLAAPAEAWAAQQGFKLVRDASSPSGVSWSSASR